MGKMLNFSPHVDNCTADLLPFVDKKNELIRKLKP